MNKYFNIPMVLLLGCAASLLGCGISEDTGSSCSDGLYVTYDSFGRSFMATHCQGCHASSSLYRYGAPTNVIFDSEELIGMQLHDLRKTVFPHWES